MGLNQFFKVFKKKKTNSNNLYKFGRTREMEVKFI